MVDHHSDRSHPRTRRGRAFAARARANRARAEQREAAVKAFAEGTSATTTVPTPEARLPAPFVPWDDGEPLLARLLEAPDFETGLALASDALGCPPEAVLMLHPLEGEGGATCCRFAFRPAFHGALKRAGARFDGRRKAWVLPQNAALPGAVGEHFLALIDFGAELVGVQPDAVLVRRPRLVLAAAGLDLAIDLPDAAAVASLETLLPTIAGWLVPSLGQSADNPFVVDLATALLRRALFGTLPEDVESPRVRDAIEALPAPLFAELELLNRKALAAALHLATEPKKKI